MFFFEPSASPLDLNFRLFGIPVRVHPFFWAVSALLGYSAIDPKLPGAGLQYLLLWIACAFVSILIHEMGHVSVGQLFGSPGHIVLYSFGGLAIGSSTQSNRWQRIAVYLAGPLAGFLFLGVVLLCLWALNPDRLWFALANLKADLGFQVNVLALKPEFFRRTLVGEAVDDVIWINLFWGVLNLLPIWPLDGGQTSRDFLGWMMPRRAIAVSLGISIATAGLLGAYFLYQKEFYNAMFFAFLAFGSFQAYQQAGSPRERLPREQCSPSWERERAPWEQDPDFWKR